MYQSTLNSQKTVKIYAYLPYNVIYPVLWQNLELASKNIAMSISLILFSSEVQNPQNA